MKNRFGAVGYAIVLGAVPVWSVYAATPRTIAFQGVLSSTARVPLPDGTYPTVTFRLYDHLAGPAQLWIETKPVVVAGGHGVFATALGSATAIPDSLNFDQPYWLSVQVGSDPELAPRLSLQSVPYALNAWSVGGNAGTNPTTSFLGTTDNQPLVLKANGHRALQLQDVVNAAGTVRSVNTLGGAETNSVAAGVVGATIAGGGGSSLNEVHGDFGVISGGSGNFVDAFAHGVIAGGNANYAQGGFTVIGGGQGNNTQADYTVIAGGAHNYVIGKYGTVSGGFTNQTGSPYTFVGGGQNNAALGSEDLVVGGSYNKAAGSAAVIVGGQANGSTGLASVVVGGQLNKASGGRSFIGGGWENEASAPVSTVSGGSGNKVLTTSTVQDSAAYGTIGGGLTNAVYGAGSTVSGGQGNIVNSATATNSVIGGGFQNYISGASATIPGGYANYATGDFSFAAGRKADATFAGSFVWADDSIDAYFGSTAANQFCVRAAGGMLLEMGGSAYIFTGTDSVELNRFLELFNSPGRPSASGLKAGGILCADDFGFANPDKNSLIVKQAVAIGTNSSGGRALYVNGPAGGTTGWNNTSDARLKTNVSTIDAALDIVNRLRGVTFVWRTDTGLRVPQGRQIGLVAQEVEKVLPSVVATDDAGYKSVAYANVVPVLIEAVKEQQKEIAALRARASRVDDLEARLEQLERRTVTGSR